MPMKYSERVFDFINIFKVVSSRSFRPRMLIILSDQNKVPHDTKITQCLKLQVCEIYVGI